MGIKIKKIKDVKSKNLLLLSLSVLFFSSCGSTIGVRSPLNSFISPEASSTSLKGEINGFFSSASRNNLEIDTSSNTINDTVTRDTEAQDTIGLNATLGLIERLDLVGVSSGGKTPTMLGLRYQLLGETKAKASKGNHSLSIIALYGNQESIQENDEALELTARDEEATAEVEIATTDIRLVYGYRFQDKKMIYGGLSSVTIKYDALFESDNAAFDGQEFSGGAKAIGAHLGIALYAKQAFHMKVEAAGQKIKWEKHKEQTIGVVLASVGLFWD
jgi:hypothetical protein